MYANQYDKGAGKPAIPTGKLLLGVAAAAALSVFLLRPATEPAGGATHGGHGTHIHAQTAADAGGAARPRTVVKPLSCQPLPHVPGKSVTTATVEFPPGAFTPRHRHPGSVTAYVTKGAIRSQLEGGPPEVFPTGGTWFEPPGTIHLFAENASATEPAEIVAVFVAETDCGPLTIFD